MMTPLNVFLWCVALGGGVGIGAGVLILSVAASIRLADALPWAGQNIKKGSHDQH